MLKQVAVVLMKPNMHELLEEVTAELDKPDYFNWRYLGKQHGIEDHVLDCIEAKSKCASNYIHSPSSELIKMPNISMLKVQNFADSLRSMEKGGLAVMIENKVPGMN